ncbi:hypothetical protein QJS10_CPB17g01214 [Acorus calamus]|uniref:Reverse transcriptase zinc-binding domain-containing protein n=1 Tax=Acorus calamus TaxID=4465 RepID=A0AAV9CRG9_ACOCL|nr:hypothetical protein QJS10_CPB17g01214 [Acorus calamus]
MSARFRYEQRMGGLLGYQPDTRLSRDPNAEGLSHILYADDLVVMSTATPTQSQAVRRVLQDVHHMMGLTVSWPKSTVRFSPKVHPRWRRWMSRILRLKVAAGGWKYLGVPVLGERSRRARYSFVVDRVKQHIQGWKSQQLTMAGRLLLIKSVLNALPIHLLHATTLPLSTIHDIEQATRSFLWSGEARRRSVHLLNWETVTSPHSLGGLGLKKLQVVRKAVLAKLAFQILLQPNITRELLALKYGWAGNPWEIQHTSRSDPVWKSLSTGLKLIHPQLRRIPGVFNDTDLLRDPWFASIPFSCIPTFINMQAACLDYQLSDVVDSNGWNVQALHNVFPAYWVDMIAHARVPQCTDDGRPIWVWDGLVLPFPRLRDFYSALDNPVWAPTNQRWGHIWILPVFSKVKLFLWKLCWNRLPTRCYLDSIGLRMDRTCPVCEATFETSFHLFWECSFTADCWRLAPSSMLPPQEVWTTQSWIEVFEDRHWTHTHSSQVKRLFFIAMLWGLWKMRNQVLFKRRTPSMIWVVSQAITHTREWSLSLDHRHMEQNRQFISLLALNQGKIHNPVFEVRRSPSAETTDSCFVVTDGSIHTFLELLVQPLFVWKDSQFVCLGQVLRIGDGLPCYVWKRRQLQWE